jgi:hypothetical protein
VDETDWAWAAGLFEGEGSIYLIESRPAASLPNCDIEVVDRFADIVGGTVYGPYEPTAGQWGRQPRWVWRINGVDDCLAFVARVGLYLGTRRRSRGQEVLLGAVEPELWRPRRIALDVLDFAWGAGLFDAEGSASWCGGPVMALRMVDEDVVDWMGKIFGGKVYGPYLPRSDDGHLRKPVWHWKVGGWEACETAAIRMDPWLSRRRRSRLREILVERIYSKRPGRRM